MTRIGVIGGSGFYSVTKEHSIKKVKTPFGKAQVQFSTLNDKEIVFISRHSERHSIPPHLVNYRANIYALYSMGIDRIIASSAVGSLLENIHPGMIVIPDQFIDFTKNRPKTFFDGKFSVKLHSGEIKKGVVHIDLTAPFCKDINTTISTVAKSLKLPLKEQGIYVCTEGPRFETPAEINAFRMIGGIIVGMTSVSECVLARELGMCYSTICLVTNYAAGMQYKVTIKEVLQMFNQQCINVQQLIKKTIDCLNVSQEHCQCNQLE